MSGPHERAAAPPPAPRLGQAVEFLRLLWALDHRLQTTSRQMERTVGLTGPQRFVLRIVGRRPGISPGEVAEILHVDPSTVTPHLKGLSRRGFLTRRRDARDRRRALLVLTERGRRLDRLHSGTLEGAVRRLLAGTSKSTMEAARRVFLKLGAELDGAAVRTRPRNSGRLGSPR
jgi:DNA-binding MarR family transcriptional regulator